MTYGVEGSFVFLNAKNYSASMNVNTYKINKIDVDECKYFYRMLDPFGSRYAKRYIEEERYMLQEFFSNYSNTKQMDFVAVGAGELCHIRMALEHAKNYIAIEPLAELFINDSVNFFWKKNLL